MRLFLQPAESTYIYVSIESNAALIVYLGTNTSLLSSPVIIDI